MHLVPFVWQVNQIFLISSPFRRPVCVHRCIYSPHCAFPCRSVYSELGKGQAQASAHDTNDAPTFCRNANPSTNTQKSVMSQQCFLKPRAYACYLCGQQYGSHRCNFAAKVRFEPPNSIRVYDPDISCNLSVQFGLSAACGLED